METKLAQVVRVTVFEGSLVECQKKVNEWLRDNENRPILDISVSEQAILVAWEVR
ncbi:hypothetical protein ES708_01415 [subsurface metagenome]